MILLTGGTGRTASFLVPLLERANHRVLLTSRHGTVDPSSSQPVRFDWTDVTTFENPFIVAGQDHIDRVYIALPPTLGLLSNVKAFIDLAIVKGVKRFVLLSATVCERGESDMGGVHEYLVQVGVDYCVLRPTWFMENLTGEQLEALRDDSALYSAAENGKIPWIAAEDIADAACSALLDEKSHNTDHILVGPDLYTFDEVAAMLSDILGRTIRHVRLPVTELTDLCISTGLQKEWSSWLCSLDVGIAAGSEERTNARTDKIVGTRKFEDFLKVHRECWITSR